MDLSTMQPRCWAKIGAFLLVTMATASLSNASPLRCHLRRNPTAKQLDDYRLCLQEMDAYEDDDDYDAKINEVLDTDEDFYADSDSRKFLDSLGPQQLLAFPECEELSVQECRLLLSALEELSTKYRKKRSLTGKRVPSNGNDQAQMISFIQKWRAENGYGKAVGRWGRSEDAKAKSIMVGAIRKKRSDIEFRRDDIRAMIEDYKRWREENGYGKSSGRWG